MNILIRCSVIAMACLMPYVASACPFCSAVSLTFSQEIAQSEATVIAELIEPPPADALLPTAEGPLPKGKFSVVEVLKGGEAIEMNGHVGVDADPIETIFLEDKPVGSLYLLMAVEPPELVWSSPIPVSQRAVEYIRQLSQLPEKGADRLAFFQKYLEDEDDTLARDAYDEFAVAPYDDLKVLEDRMDPTQLLAWVTNPDVQTNRRRLYATMLGVCGTKADGKTIERILVGEDLSESQAEARSGLDALIACYITLVGPDGLDLIDRLFLDRQGRDIPFTETYAAVMALRFLGEESEIVPQDRVLASLRLLLDQPKLADLVIADLARWKDWSVVDRLVELFETATAENIFVREPIVNYMRTCPLPEANQALETLEKIDPDAVRRAATMAGLAGLATAGSDSEDENDVVSAESTEASAMEPQEGVTDAELINKVLPVLAEEHPADEFVVQKSKPEPLPVKTPASRKAPAAMWFVWVVIVVLVGMISRRMLRASSTAQ